jgi:hypothetical protein
MSYDLAAKACTDYLSLLGCTILKELSMRRCENLPFLQKTTHTQKKTQCKEKPLSRSYDILASLVDSHLSKENRSKNRDGKHTQSGEEREMECAIESTASPPVSTVSLILLTLDIVCIFAPWFAIHIRPVEHLPKRQLVTMLSLQNSFKVKIYHSAATIQHVLGFKTRSVSLDIIYHF